MVHISSIILNLLGTTVSLGWDIPVDSNQTAARHNIEDRITARNNPFNLSNLKDKAHSRKPKQWLRQRRRACDTQV